MIGVTCPHLGIRSTCTDCWREEAEKRRAAIARHHAQHADDLCWLDDDDLYAAAGLPPKNLCVGDPKAMLRNCKRFIRQRCMAGGDWKSYAELEAENAKLRALLGPNRYCHGCGASINPPPPPPRCAGNCYCAACLKSDLAKYLEAR